MVLLTPQTDVMYDWVSCKTKVNKWLQRKQIYRSPTKETNQQVT